MIYLLSFNFEMALLLHRVHHHNFKYCILYVDQCIVRLRIILFSYNDNNITVVDHQFPISAVNIF